MEEVQRNALLLQHLGCVLALAFCCSGIGVVLCIWASCQPVGVSLTLADLLSGGQTSHPGSTRGCVEPTCDEGVTIIPTSARMG